ncbi:ZPR1 zinc finger domain-containing protein [archaeon]|nr:ZPR1 zinc finger domain-containing protein [archaeon]
MPERLKPKTMVVECPECGAKAVISEHVINLPNFGDALFSVLSCTKCGFKLNDVMPAEFHEPKAFEIKVASQKDMEAKVVRSSSGTIEIPELGVKIEPGPMAEGYITNIEGILERIEQATKTALRQKDSDESDESKLAVKELKLIQDARNTRISFRFIIVDPFGNSALLGPKVKSVKLTEEQIMLLKKETAELDLT